jgi:hypothetical protein
VNKNKKIEHIMEGGIPYSKPKCDMCGVEADRLILININTEENWYNFEDFAIFSPESGIWASQICANCRDDIVKNWKVKKVKQNDRDIKK